jgi:rod shape determining protein RodA
MLANAPTRPVRRSALGSLQHNPAAARHHIDWVLLATAVVLAGVGLVAIYSAKYQLYHDNGIDPYVLVKRQGVALGLGAVGLVTAMLIDYRRLRDFALPLFAGSTLALVALLLFAPETNGAKAWFDIGSFQLQPAEFAKVALVLAMAAYATSARGHTLHFGQFFVALLIAGVPTVLVLAQPDLGTAMVMVAIGMGVLLVGGAQPRHIALISFLAIVSVAVIVGTGKLDTYQYDRLTAFVGVAQPSERLDGQLIQNNVVRHVEASKTAIATGGTTGTGFLDNSITGGGFVPEQQTDFIFTTVAEQFGMVGAGSLLALYALLVFRLWRIAHLAKDMTGTLIAVGALAMVVFQVFQNTGMTMGIMPVTGIPLPLVSYGGSATVAFLGLIGLVESVHMRRFL